ncbi:MAG: VanW family protein [Defluviitaleaceae bacterium]|nr:VanW family protein [Defluviitaleaceae bacterium]
MKNILLKKPIHRSDIRLFLGRMYFTLKRHITWLFGSINFARNKSNGSFTHLYASHKTPLLRKLKDVDMYLQHNKITNLKIAAPKINNIVLRPGETFSYWKLIGRPTKLKGYKPGMVLKSGKVTVRTGGGLCQLSNLVYWLTIHTPLTVTERHRHGYDVFPDSNRTQPFGSGATCFYNYGDLMIKNNTSMNFQLQLNISDKYLEGAWLCDSTPTFRYEVYEKEHYMRSEYWGGYTRHNTICRRKYDIHGNLLDDEYVVENHAIMMYAPFLTDKNSGNSDLN